MNQNYQSLKLLKKKKIAILGFGQEGKVLAEFLFKNGIKFTILDKKEFKQFTKNDSLKISQLANNYQLGEKYLDSLDKFDLVFRSPGVRRDLAEIVDAEKKGVIISSATQLFLDLIGNRIKIIGVTGTKGKGTVSTLIYKILKREGFNCYLAGNIGRPPLAFVDTLKNGELVVLELSSFQLVDLKIKPYIGVVLMVTSEHLDWHQNQMDYLLAKANLVKNQTSDDYLVVSLDYQNSQKLAEFSQAKKYFFSRSKVVERGAYWEDDKLVFKEDGLIETVSDTSNIRLIGAHNLENVAAAVTTVKILNVTNATIVKVLRKFSGLPHRLEFVKLINNISFYDDSFATTPESAIAAVESFSNVPLVVILGGSSKNADYTNLAKTISKNTNIVGVVLIGQTAHEIEKALLTTGFNGLVIKGALNMKSIVENAYRICPSGGVVLLSPACASLDMFKNYKDRGNQFKKQVKLLATKTDGKA